MFLVTEDWYFVSHRLDLAVAARRAGYDVSVATNVSKYQKRIENAGIRLYPLTFDRGGLNPLRDILTLRTLFLLYRKEVPDIVHHVAMKPVIYGSLVARVLGIKGIVNAFGGLGYVFSSTTPRANILRLIIAPFLRLALGGSNTRIIVQNSNDRDWIVSQRSGGAEVVRLIPGSGVDLNAYRQVSVKSECPLVVLPARLLRDKGVTEFVEAASLLLSTGVKARFILVGQPDSANPASVTEAEIAAWVDRGLVEYWGWREDMASVFSQAQIICLPSYHEGLPKTLLEAAASGCAIVTTNIPGCRDVVQHGVTGWLVPVRDVQSLARSLREAIESPNLRGRYGAAARQHVAANFLRGRINGQTLAVYDELARERSS
jgi:glycosyltransferase involved in cell wall biosynthesis